MYSFALKTLFTERGKLLTALVGVVFSLVLVNIQGGLYFGLIGKASLLVDHCDADFWIGHRNVENVDFAHDIPQALVNRIRGLPGVAQAEPYIVTKGVATLADGGFEDVWIIGSDPQSMFGTAWSFRQGTPHDLRRPNAVSIDDVDAHKLAHPQIGDVLEVNGQRAKVVARTDGITGFVTTPYLFTTLQNARRYGHMAQGKCSYFLVRAKPGVDMHRLQKTLQRQVPELDVYRADEFSAMSQEYFLKRTGIGISFGAATLLGVLVGLLMVGQSLYALALDHLSDYATLKAIGAADGQVRSVVILQALTIAAIGSLIGIALVLLIQRTWSSPLAPIEIPFPLLVGGVVLVFGICLAATVLPAHRIRRIDPAVVLQG